MRDEEVEGTEKEYKGKVKECEGKDEEEHREEKLTERDGPFFLSFLFQFLTAATETEEEGGGTEAEMEVENAGMAFFLNVFLWFLPEKKEGREDGLVLDT